MQKVIFLIFYFTFLVLRALSICNSINFSACCTLLLRHKTFAQNLQRGIHFHQAACEILNINQQYKKYYGNKDGLS